MLLVIFYRIQGYAKHRAATYFALYRYTHP
jgi:hypothetical protein